MSETRSRSRSRPADQGASAGRGGGGSSVPAFAQRGSAGMERSRQVANEQQQEREKRKAVGYVRRFRLKQGEQADVIVLDDNIEDIWFMHEHAVPGPGMNFAATEEHICVKDFDNCVLCELAEGGGKNSRFKRSYYMFAVSVLNLTGYWSDKHNKQVAPVKELLVVKGANHDEFLSIFRAAQNRSGTIRGLEMTLRRSNGDTSPGTGVPTIGEDGQMFAMNDEATLVADFGHDPIKNDAGEEVRPKDYRIHKFPYDKVFTQPDQAVLRRKYGGSTPMGSSEDNDWGNEGSDGASRTTRRRGGGTAEGGQAENGGEAQASGRTRTRERTAPEAGRTAAPEQVSRTRTRQAAPPPSTADLDDEIPF